MSVGIPKQGFGEIVITDASGLEASGFRKRRIPIEQIAVQSMSPVVMHELEGVTPETAVDPKELKELIARLANPNHGAPKGSVQVKDIAETLELDESEVARQLVALRKSKETQVAPVRAEKMAAMLDSLKTSDFQPLTNQPLKRVTLMSVLAIVVLFGAFVLIAFSLSQSQPIAPPQRIRADISKAIPEVAPKAP